MNFLKYIFAKPQRSNLIFVVFMLLFLTLMVFVEKLNGKFDTYDFHVYYYAAKDYFEGKNPYVVPYGLGTGFFKYPPTTLYFFYFSLKVSFFTAQLVHTTLLLIAFIFSAFIVRKILFIEKFNNGKAYNWVLYAAFFFSVIQLVREFHMGNVNLFLLGFFCIGLYALLLQKDWGTVIAWSFMVVLKPIVIIVFIPLLFYKKWKIIGGMILFGLLFFLIPLLNKSGHELLELWAYWFQSVAKHGTYLVSQNSLTYLSNYYFGIQSNWMPSIVTLIIILFFELLRIKKTNFSSNTMLESFIVLMAFTPNFFVTDTEHFLLSMPLLLVLVVYLLKIKKWVYWLVLAFIIMPFTLRSDDLLSVRVTDFMVDIGLLGIVNLSAIFFFYFVSFKVNKMENLSETTKL
jgi:hypothetical protein